MILTQPSIDPVIFSLGYIDFRWYSLAYLLAFLIGSYLIKYLNNKTQSSKLTNIQIDNFFIWSVLGVILGGRTGYVLFYQLDQFLLNPLYITYIWEGGMSFHGGLIGITLSTYFFSKKNNINFLTLADLISIVAPIGLFLGRIANFINVELIGRVTEFPFAIIYPSIDNLPRHPSQLYEAFFEGLVLFIILIIFFIKKHPIKNHGVLSGLFLFLYGSFRFFIEFLREPDHHIGLFIELFTIGQILSMPLIMIGLLMILKKKQYA